MLFRICIKLDKIIRIIPTIQQPSIAETPFRVPRFDTLDFAHSTRVTDEHCDLGVSPARLRARFGLDPRPPTCIFNLRHLAGARAQ